MAYNKELPFDEWVKTLPDSLRNDPLWKSAYYRLSMYISDLMWLDTEKINKDFCGREIVHQVVKSLGSVCANMEEAYRRGTGTPDFVRIMRISLGELGETQGWYFRSGHIIGPEILDKRIEVIQKNNCINRHSH